jgi:hypothetical protein
MTVNPQYEFMVMGDVAVVFPRGEGFSPSPVLAACTLSRLYEGQADLIDETLMAEEIISQAVLNERICLRALPALYPYAVQGGLGMFFRLWRALLDLREKRYEEAVSELEEIIAQGFRDWRPWWYLAVAHADRGKSADAVRAVERLVSIAPSFKTRICVRNCPPD